MKLNEIHGVDVLTAPPKVHTNDEEDKKPGGATVMVLNDPITPGMLVLEAIVSATGLSQAEAMKRVMKAHQGGWAAIETYASKDMAETVAKKILDYVHSDTKYDDYRQFTNHKGPWPLAVEVVDAEQ